LKGNLIALIPIAALVLLPLIWIVVVGPGDTPLSTKPGRPGDIFDLIKVPDQTDSLAAGVAVNTRCGCDQGHWVLTKIAIEVDERE
jgi:hypothetical protein